MQRIKAVESETRLLVVDKETDEYLCSLRLTCTEEMVHGGILLNSGLSPAKSLGSDNGEVWKPQLDLSGDSLPRHSHSFSSHGSRKVRRGRCWVQSGDREQLPLRARRFPSEKNLPYVAVSSGTPLCPEGGDKLPLGVIFSCSISCLFLEGLLSSGSCWALGQRGWQGVTSPGTGDPA